MRIINKHMPINCLSLTCMKISIRQNRICDQVLIATSMNESYYVGKTV